MVHGARCHAVPRHHPSPIKTKTKQLLFIFFHRYIWKDWSSTPNGFCRKSASSDRRSSTRQGISLRRQCQEEFRTSLRLCWAGQEVNHLEWPLPDHFQRYRMPFKSGGDGLWPFLDWLGLQPHRSMFGSQFLYPGPGDLISEASSLWQVSGEIRTHLDSEGKLSCFQRVFFGHQFANRQCQNYITAQLEQWPPLDQTGLLFRSRIGAFVATNCSHFHPGFLCHWIWPFTFKMIKAVQFQTKFSLECNFNSDTCLFASQNSKSIISLQTLD